MHCLFFGGPVLLIFSTLSRVRTCNFTVCDTVKLTFNSWFLVVGAIGKNTKESQRPYYFFLSKKWFMGKEIWSMDWSFPRKIDKNFFKYSHLLKGSLISEDIFWIWFHCQKRSQMSPLNKKFEFPAPYRKQSIQIFYSGKKFGTFFWQWDRS